MQARLETVRNDCVDNRTHAEEKKFEKLRQICSEITFQVFLAKCFLLLSCRVFFSPQNRVTKTKLFAKIIRAMSK